MLHRFTIDVVAEAITEQVLTGRPNSKLLNRFYRKGKRDGRRELTHHPIAGVISDAVGVAHSRVRQAYTERRQQLERRQAELGATLANPLVTSQAGRMDQGGAPPVEGVDGAGGLSSLEHAAKVLEDRARSQAADYAGMAAGQARTELESIRAELQTLAQSYLRQSETCVAVGELLWSRYVSGYAWGQRRHDPQDRRELPIDLPVVLGRDVVSVAMDDVHVAAGATVPSGGGQPAPLVQLVDGGPPVTVGNGEAEAVVPQDEGSPGEGG